MKEPVYVRIYPYSFDKECCLTIPVELDNITLKQAMKEIDRRYPDHDIKEIYRDDHLIAKKRYYGDWKIKDK